MEDKDIVYHITVCTKRVISVINEKLKNSGLNQSKRKRFVKSLEASTIEKLANNEIWDPQNPYYRSSDRIFRLFDETFCKAVLLSKNSPTEIESDPLQYTVKGLILLIIFILFELVNRCHKNRLNFFKGLG